MSLRTALLVLVGTATASIDSTAIMQTRVVTAALDVMASNRSTDVTMGVPELPDQFESETDNRVLLGFWDGNVPLRQDIGTAKGLGKRKWSMSDGFFVQFKVKPTSVNGWRGMLSSGTSHEGFLFNIQNNGAASMHNSRNSWQSGSQGMIGANVWNDVTFKYVPPVSGASKGKAYVQSSKNGGAPVKNTHNSHFGSTTDWAVNAGWQGGCNQLYGTMEDLKIWGKITPTPSPTPSPTPLPTPSPTPVPTPRDPGTKIAGKFLMATDDPEEFIKNADKVDAIKKSIAGIAGVDEAQVSVFLKVKTVTARALLRDGAASQTSRAEQILVKYLVFVPLVGNTVDDVSSTTASFDTAAAEAIENKLRADGAKDALSTLISTNCGCTQHVESMTAVKTVDIAFSAKGDPHVTNVQGESFDILRTGMHSFIEIPRGQGSQLIVKGRIERVKTQCNTMYIRQLSIGGSLLKSKYEFKVNPAEIGFKDITTPRFFYSIGNFTTGDPTEFENAVGSSEVYMRMSPKSPSEKIKKNVKITLFVGDAQVAVRFKKTWGVREDHLDLDVQDLGTVAGANNIGGLLGVDDHSWAASEEGCDGAKVLLSTQGTHEGSRIEAGL